jgi:hypothetical protein
MAPRTRFTTHQNVLTRTWTVFDNLLGYAIRSRLAQAAAMNLARDYEAEWRRQCAAWIEAEHRATPDVA